ncbi:MAG: hypothetical protein R6U66_03265, partial [Bacteroidales bacterium]
MQKRLKKKEPRRGDIFVANQNHDKTKPRRGGIEHQKQLAVINAYFAPSGLPSARPAIYYNNVVPSGLPLIEGSIIGSSEKPRQEPTTTTSPPKMQRRLKKKEPRRGDIFVA